MMFWCWCLEGVQREFVEDVVESFVEVVLREFFEIEVEYVEVFVVFEFEYGWIEIDVQILVVLFVYDFVEVELIRVEIDGVVCQFDVFEEVFEDVEEVFVRVVGIVNVFLFGVCDNCDFSGICEYLGFLVFVGVFGLVCGLVWLLVFDMLLSEDFSVWIFFLGWLGF